MTKLLEQLMSAALEPLQSRIRDAAWGRSDIEPLIRQVVKEVSDRYRKVRLRGKANPNPYLLEKYDAELREAEARITDNIRQRLFQERQRRDIARIEYPALRHIVAGEMAAKGIRYIFKTKGDRNILVVRVVSDVFLVIPVTLENVEKVTGMIKYFILRPECAAEEIPGARAGTDRRLARDWDKLSETGKEEPENK